MAENNTAEGVQCLQREKEIFLQPRSAARDRDDPIARIICYQIIQIFYCK